MTLDFKIIKSQFYMHIKLKKISNHTISKFNTNFHAFIYSIISKIDFRGRIFASFFGFYKGQKGLFST